MSRITWKPAAPGWSRRPGMGSVPMLRRRTPLAAGFPDRRPRYSRAALRNLTHARDVARAAL